MLTAAELQSLATAIYGSRWQSAFARDRSIALRTVSRWARDGIEKPATAAAVRDFLEERRRTALDPPASDDPDERDDQARDLVEPRVEALLSASAAVGWHDAEILGGLLGAVVDRMVDGAGVPAARETLRQTIAQLDARLDR